MVNQELQDFINKSRVSGMSDEKIKQLLLPQGWTAQDIEEGFRVIVIPTPSIPNTSNSFVTPVQTKNHFSTKILAYLSVILLLFSFYLLFLGSAFLAFFPSWVIVDLALLSFIISGILGILHSYYKEKNKGVTTKSALITASKFILIIFIGLLIAIIYLAVAAGGAFKG